MRFGLILGDPLQHQLGTLKALNRTREVILMAEVVEEATYVAHQPQASCAIAAHTQGLNYHSHQPTHPK